MISFGIYSYNNTLKSFKKIVLEPHSLHNYQIMSRRFNSHIKAGLVILGINIVYNNAGVLDLNDAPTGELETKIFDKIIEINLKGIFLSLSLRHTFID